MPFLTLLDLFFGLFVISLVVNLTSSRLPIHYVPSVMRWGWFSSAIYVTIRIMSIDSIQQYLRGTFRPSVLSFLAAATLGAAVAIVYWVIIIKVIPSKPAESQQTAKAEQTPPLPSQKPVQNELRFVVPDALQIIRVTVNRQHFWTHLGALNDQLEGQGFLNRRFEEKGLPLTIRTSGTDPRPYVDTKVYSAKLGLVEIKNNRLTTRPEGWDENSSDRLIEIVNEHRIPVFRMVLSAANQIDIEAIFSEQESKRWSMVPWFKYPSGEHRGEYAVGGFLPLTAKSVFQLFLEGCGKAGGAHDTYRLKSAPKPNGMEVDYMVCMDFESRAVYLNIFIPWPGGIEAPVEAVALSRMFAAEYKDLLATLLKLQTIVRRSPGAPIERSSDLVFTGVIGIYHEADFLMGESEKITAEFKKHGARVRFFGPDYAILQNSPLSK
ncbi:MAG TPA: hypothetical protein VGJ37_09065 [Pyrinomonadaceae bacterium]|jgi:hypothetical protein